MGFSTFGRDSKLRRKKKPATRQPKIRWSVLGLSGPEDASLSIDVIRQRVSSMARHDLEEGVKRTAMVERASRGRNQLSGTGRNARREATG